MRHSLRIMLAVLGAVACSDSSRHHGAVAEARASVVVPDTSTPAAQHGDIEFYSAAQLTHVADELAKGSSTGRTIGGHPTYHYVEARRVLNGEPEVHDRWADVTIIQSGRATLLTGGRVNGGRLEPDGEHRGGTIVGGVSRPIAAGDVFVVPAGVPHQFLLSHGDSVRYLTLKELQPMGMH